MSVVGGGITGDDGVERLGDARSEAGLIDQGLHVAGAERALRKRGNHAALDLRLAVDIEQAEELADLGFEVDTATRNLLQVHRGPW